MGFRSVAIIMAVITQIDFQHLAYFFQQCQGFINRRMAHGWEAGVDFCVKLTCAGVAIANGDQPHKLHPLGSQAEILFLEGCDHS